MNKKIQTGLVEGNEITYKVTTKLGVVELNLLKSESMSDSMQKVIGFFEDFRLIFNVSLVLKIFEQGGAVDDSILYDMFQQGTLKVLHHMLEQNIIEEAYVPKKGTSYVMSYRLVKQDE